MKAVWKMEKCMEKGLIIFINKIWSTQVNSMTIFSMDGGLLKKVMDLNLPFTKEIFSMEKNMAKENINMDLTIFTMATGHLIWKMEKESINILKGSIMANGKVIKNTVKEP